MSHNHSRSHNNAYNPNRGNEKSGRNHRYNHNHYRSNHSHNNNNINKNFCSRYDEAESWCHRIIQIRDDILFDPQAFHRGVSKAAKKFGYTFESIDSLLRHVHLQHVKKRTYKIRGNISTIANQYNKGKSIIKLSKDANYSPYMMSRLLVEYMHIDYNGNSKSKTSHKRYVTDAMKYPVKYLVPCFTHCANGENSNGAAIHRILRAEFVQSELVGSLGVHNIKNENICVDPFSLRPIDNSNPEKITRIAREVTQAINQDPLYGPRHDKQRRVIGLEHEIILEQALHAMKIPFETETDLRIKGTSRTPDILLSCPVGVKIPVSRKSVREKNIISNSDNDSMDSNTDDAAFVWRTICWIDSKAMFGDVQTHNSETLPQAEAFVHRFGPGLIIYWYGHAPLERLNNGYGDVSILAWNVPEFLMLPTGTYLKQGGDNPSFSP